jgi:CubicO group peptidase (beta-lactamase class C family)
LAKPDEETAMTGTPSLPRANAAEVGLSEKHLRAMSAALQSRCDAGHLPGAVTLVARRGRVAWLDSVGVRNPQDGSAMSSDSIFRIYSMTKPIVSVAAMSLLEEGRLQLIDPVSRYLPAFANPRVLKAGGAAGETVAAEREITIQDLLRHTSGLTYELLGDGPVHQQYQAARFNDFTRPAREHIDVLAKIPLIYQPGTRYAYSRSTDVLACVLEVICGQSLGELLNERVLGPLQMTETGFHVDPANHGRIAEAFPIDPDAGTEVRLLEPRVKPALEMGGGGLMSTAQDYARFCQMLLNGGSLDGVRILGRKTLELMSADHLGPIPLAGDQVPPGHGFGLGFAVRLAQGIAPFPGSAGQYFWSGIAGTHFWIDPAEQMFALMLIQAPGQRDYYRNLFRAMVYSAIEN